MAAAPVAAKRYTEYGNDATNVSAKIDYRRLRYSCRLSGFGKNRFATQVSTGEADVKVSRPAETLQQYHVTSQVERIICLILRIQNSYEPS